MKKIISAVIAVFAVLAAVTLAFGVVLVLAWPLWVGFFILLVMAGIATAVVFARQIVLRRREERFVSSIVAQDEEAVRGLEDEERRRRTELQEKFRQAVGALRASHLRKLGNPLYVLPWYMVIGESGSGKTRPSRAHACLRRSPRPTGSRVSRVPGTATGGSSSRPSSSTRPAGTPSPWTRAGTSRNGSAFWGSSRGTGGGSRSAASW